MVDAALYTDPDGYCRLYGDVYGCKNPGVMLGLGIGSAVISATGVVVAGIAIWLRYVRRHTKWSAAERVNLWFASHSVSSLVIWLLIVPGWLEHQYVLRSVWYNLAGPPLLFACFEYISNVIFAWPPLHLNAAEGATWQKRVRYSIWIISLLLLSITTVLSVWVGIFAIQRMHDKEIGFGRIILAIYAVMCLGVAVVVTRFGRRLQSVVKQRADVVAQYAPFGPQAAPPSQRVQWRSPSLLRANQRHAQQQLTDDVETKLRNSVDRIRTLNIMLVTVCAATGLLLLVLSITLHDALTHPVYSSVASFLINIFCPIGIVLIQSRLTLSFYRQWQLEQRAAKAKAVDRRHSTRLHGCVINENTINLDNDDAFLITDATTLPPQLDSRLLWLPQETYGADEELKSTTVTGDANELHAMPSSFSSLSCPQSRSQTLGGPPHTSGDLLAVGGDALIVRHTTASSLDGYSRSRSNSTCADHSR